MCYSQRASGFLFLPGVTASRALPQMELRAAGTLPLWIRG